MLHSEWQAHHTQALHRLANPARKAEKRDGEDESASHEQSDARYAALVAKGLGWHTVLPNGTVEREAEYVHALRRRARRNGINRTQYRGASM